MILSLLKIDFKIIKISEDYFYYVLKYLLMKTIFGSDPGLSLISHSVTPSLPEAELFKFLSIQTNLDHF